jgi:hypothetical protein
MPTTVEQFKRAFARKGADIYKPERAKVVTAVQDAESYIKSLTDLELAKQFATGAAAVHKGVKDADGKLKNDPLRATAMLAPILKDASTLNREVREAADKQFASVKEALTKGGEPKKSDLEALAKMPGANGAKRLDELVSQLSDKAQAKVFKLAFEIRFGIKVETYKDKKGLDEQYLDDKGNSIPRPEWEATDETKPNKSLQRMYELFAKVPESHVSAAQNKSLKKVIHFEKDARGAAYWSATKNIYMEVSRGEGTGAKDQSTELATGITAGIVMFPEPPKRDPNCTPINTGVKTPYFDWATLHEVGHAVDDKSGFMKNKGKNSEFGGWKPETVDTVAAAGAAEFKWDKNYIKLKLEGKPAEVPAKLKKLDKWEDIRDKVDAWCNSIRDPDTSNMWWDGQKSKDNAIGKRVYQEAYAGQWLSYELAARAKGIHGYQFRAPAEWFAELYAAYYSGKLQDAHPFVPELKKLEKPRK